VQGSADGDYGSALTLSFDQPQQAASVERMLTGISKNTVASREVAAAAAGGKGPQGAALACNKPYSFQDPDGTYLTQHQCGGTTSPWTYYISPAVCAIVISSVDEAGLSWTLNGKGMPRMAPHSGAKSQPCTYAWHGTYNPAHDNDHISYVDMFTFQVRGGHGTLQIWLL
jgi:hypothetical protein